MKKYLLLLVVTFFVLASCQKSNTEVHNFLTKNVSDAELLVSYHDSLIQKLLEERLYDSIPRLTQETTALLGQKLTAVHSLEAPNTANDYKSATGLYIESLLRVVKAEDVYSSYNDSISEYQMQSWDNLNIEAANTAKALHSKYIEAKKAFSKANSLQ